MNDDMIDDWEDEPANKQTFNNLNPDVSAYLSKIRKQGIQEKPAQMDRGNIAGNLPAAANSIRSAFGTPQAQAPGMDYKEKNPNKGGLQFMDRALAGASGKKVPVKKQYSKSLNKTRITYNDGTVEELEGLNAN